MNIILRSLSLTAILLLAALPVWAEECLSRPVDGKVDEFAVTGNSDGAYKGYVALERDGTWFGWVDGQGALNGTFDNAQDAIDAVCRVSKR